MHGWNIIWSLILEVPFLLLGAWSAYRIYQYNRHSRSLQVLCAALVLLLAHQVLELYSVALDAETVSESLYSALRVLAFLSAAALGLGIWAVQRRFEEFTFLTKDIDAGVKATFKKPAKRRGRK